MVGAKELLSHQLETKSKEATEARSEVTAAEGERVLMQKIASMDAEIKELRASNKPDGSKA